MAEDDYVKVPRRAPGVADPPMGGRGDAPRAGALPLAHMTALGAAKRIVDDGQIGLKHCPIFDRSLIYFFVARPAYRLRHGAKKSAYISMFPCLFMAMGEKIGNPYQAYPLDTGGLMAGVFGDRPDPFVHLEDYELEPSLVAAEQHVTWAFGDLEAYYRGDLKPGLSETLEQWDSVGIAFATLARLTSSQSNKKPDLRASSVEVAYDIPIPIKGNIDYAIFPKQFLDGKFGINSKFIRKLEDLGVEWDFYDWQANKTPNEYNEEIGKLVHRRLFGDGSS